MVTLKMFPLHFFRLRPIRLHANVSLRTSPRGHCGKVVDNFFKMEKIELKEG